MLIQNWFDPILLRHEPNRKLWMCQSKVPILFGTIFYKMIFCFLLLLGNLTWIFSPILRKKTASKSIRLNVFLANTYKTVILLKINDQYNLRTCFTMELGSVASSPLKSVPILSDRSARPLSNNQNI